MRTVAIIDCLNSLAVMARTKEGYTRPTIVDEPQVSPPFANILCIFVLCISNFINLS